MKTLGNIGVKRDAGTKQIIIMQNTHYHIKLNSLLRKAERRTASPIKGVATEIPGFEQTYPHIAYIFFIIGDIPHAWKSHLWKKEFKSFWRSNFPR